jgi:hypothetical protein
MAHHPSLRSPSTRIGHSNSRKEAGSEDRDGGIGTRSRHHTSTRTPLLPKNSKVLFSELKLLGDVYVEDRGFRVSVGLPLLATRRYPSAKRSQCSLRSHPGPGRPAMDSGGLVVGNPMTRPLEHGTRYFGFEPSGLDANVSENGQDELTYPRSKVI